MFPYLMVPILAEVFHIHKQEFVVTDKNRRQSDDADKLLAIPHVILLILSLPLIAHISALLCFEYGLEKEKRMKTLKAYKILLICMSIIALTGILTTGIVLYTQLIR